MIKYVLLSPMQEHCPASAGSQLQPSRVGGFPLSTSLLAQSGCRSATEGGLPQGSQC